MLSVPSKFVSPPIESSDNDVNATGEAAVPTATSRPFTVRSAEEYHRFDFTTAPGFTVNVTPGANVNP